MPRKQKKYHYIYKTTCIITERYYYGMHSTSDLEDDYLGSGKRLKYSVNKYGKENHEKEILEFYPSRKKLKERETKIVNEELLNDPKCMNLQPGGGGWHGWINEEHKQKNIAAFSKAGNKKIKYLCKYDAKFLENRKNNTRKLWKIAEYRNKIEPILKQNWIGKKHSEESKNKMRLSQQGKQKGEKNSQYGTCWITNKKENKKINKNDDIPNGWKLGRKIK